MISTIFKSFAKLNLSLYIGQSKKHRALHELNSLFCEIDLCDTITIKKTNQQTLVRFHNISIPETNTCTKVIEVFGDRLKNQWEIDVYKNIPTGAGLGGGSSNAATLIRALNKAESLNYSASELLEIAQKIGSDTPYFLYGGLCKVSGYGQIVTPLRNSIPFFFVIIFPSIACDTAAVYRAFDTLPSPEPAMETLSNDDLFSYGTNQLADACFLIYPAIKKIKKQLENLIMMPVYLSGSGSTLFTILKTEKDQNDTYDLIRKKTNLMVKKCKLNNGGTEGRT